MKLLAAVIEAMMPIFEMMGNFLKYLADQARLVGAFFVALWKLGQDLDIFEVLAQVGEFFIRVLKEVGNNLFLFSIALLKLIGQTAFARDAVDALRQGQDKAEVNAAPQDIAIKQWDQIRQDLATSAFGAGGQQGKKSQDDYLQELVDRADRMLEDNGTMASAMESIGKVISGAISTAWSGVVTAIGCLPGTIIKAIRGF
jgi:hypothetical protein